MDAQTPVTGLRLLGPYSPCCRVDVGCISLRVSPWRGGEQCAGILSPNTSPLGFHDLSFSTPGFFPALGIYQEQLYCMKHGAVPGDGEPEHPAESGPKLQQAPYISSDTNATFSLLLLNPINGI